VGARLTATVDDRMYRFAFRPKWLLFHLLVVVLVVVMVNLGIWQYHRLQGRRAFNDEVRSRAAVPVAEFEAVVTNTIVSLDDADQVEWRTVRATGTYLADEQVLVINRSQGGEPGEDVVTPLQLASGELVLVNRGFVAETDAVPAPPAGPVVVTGRLRSTEKRSFGGLTDPADGDLTELQRLDIPRLAEQLPGPVAPVYITLLTSDPASAADPLPIPDPELDEGPHQSYMIQWFIFSICAIVGWVLALRRSARRLQLSAAAERAQSDSRAQVDGEPTTAPQRTPPP
jgi:surfeit locus 1 family protein